MIINNISNTRANTRANTNFGAWVSHYQRVEKPLPKSGLYYKLHSQKVAENASNDTKGAAVLKTLRILIKKGELVVTRVGQRCFKLSDKAGNTQDDMVLELPSLSSSGAQTKDYINIEHLQDNARTIVEDSIGHGKPFDQDFDKTVATILTHAK